ncbi:MAG: Fic family protein [Eubacterium sp.]|nr:Fic family protein [Eubacterium sp.]
MPIIGLNGKVIKEEDIGFLTEMLRGSLENHIYHLTEWQRTAAARAEDPAFYDRILQHFRNGVDHLSEKINAAREGKRKIKVPDLIKEVYSGISREIVEQLRQEDMNQLGISVAVDSFLNYEASEWGDGNLAREYPNKQEMKIGAKDTDAGYTRTESAFRFVTEPLDGIEEIEEYDPAKDSVAALYSGRAGNSGTLNPAKEGYQEKMAGLIIGGETARGRSVELRNKAEVSFGDLFETLTRLNKVVMTNDPQGGKLRGFGITSNDVIGSGTFAAPVNVYKTLSQIADGINQIKKVEDPALRKTRAIQLAAFSYQMLVSEHVFADANGRTGRLFADTILQTFGLPPHTPVKDKVKLVHTMGEPMDFNAGADTFFEGIRKSDRILREERENAPEPEEEKLNTRQGLLSEIKAEMARKGGQIAESEVYRDYIQAMDVLDSKMEELSQRDAEEREHSLTAQEKEDLLARMVRVAETGERFLDSGKEAGKDLSKGVFGMVSRLQTMVSKDHDIINEYRPETHRSLRELQEDSRTVTIDLRNRNIKTLGHLTSSRIPMTIYGANGKRRTGVFTKTVKSNVKARFDAIVRKAAKGCDPEAVAELRGMLPAMAQEFARIGRKRYDDTPFKVDDPPEVVLGSFLAFGHGVRKANRVDKLNSRDIRQMLRLCKVKEERIPDSAMKVLTEGLNEMFANAANQIISGSLELPDGSRMDHRNSAMSVVAGLLGAGSLLARSDSVRCIDKDGKLVEGTFMDFGKGLDLDGDKSLIRHINDNPLNKTKNRNAVIRSLADLQIIDYLCLNVDRHSGNLMYQVDAAGNITGIQGIDNDSSFGRRRCANEENTTLRVISKSMAEKVNKLSPEMMRFALRGRGLTDEEVSWAVERLKDLKSLIERKVVATVPDNKFADLSNKKLYPADKDSINTIRTTLGLIRSLSKKRIADHIPFVPYVERPVELSKVSTTDRKYTVGGMVDLSEKAQRMLTDTETDFNVSKINSFGRRSNEFTELLDAVRSVSNVPVYLRRSNRLDEEKFVSDLNAGESLMVFDEAFNTLNEKVKTYLRKKTRERGLDETGNIRGKNDYEKKRIAYAKSVLSLVKQYQARRNGPVNKADKMEEKALKDRRDQNKKNIGRNAL